ncbi:hypothetical protein MMC06_002740 [Schaereria dolodes]|nr:hypothetical protein [Schaereria dolodes]
MVKRARENEDEVLNTKRVRFSSGDKLSALSDEIILRTLSFLPVHTLSLCQRISRRFCVLAGDHQLWKSAYYNRFVRPRASRIPGIREQKVVGAPLYYSSKISKWLEEDRLVKKGIKTDWKRQYKIRHNWSRGSCDMSEIQITERPSRPPLLVRLHEDTVITADGMYGLRAWSIKGKQILLATIKLDSCILGTNTSEGPTSLAVDFTKASSDALEVSVGFIDGRFAVYIFKKQDRLFVLRYMHVSSTNGMLSAIAFASPYLLTMTEAQLLSLYRFPDESSADQIRGPPRLLSSLKSHTAWPPLSLAIRASTTSIVASIAYAVPTYLSGWSVGLQELRLSPEGSIIQSRLTSASNQGFTPLFSTSSGTASPVSDIGSSPTPRLHGRAMSMTQPTSISYSHPYLLASHPDNTLTLYLVTSSDKELYIAEGDRLWGHTSSVTGAQVGDRGKAVSVSSHGGEIRIWELEGGTASTAAKKRTGEISVQLRPDRTRVAEPQVNVGSSAIGNGSIEGFRHDLEHLSTTRGWVGFDEEKVVVLREKGRGSQALVIYDFS